MSLGGVTGIASAIVGVAFIAVALGSPNLSNVLKAIFDGFAGSLRAAMGH